MRSGSYKSYVLRFWCDESGRAVRGQVTEVATKVIENFTDWEGLIEFLREHVGELGQEPFPVDLGRPRLIR